LFVSNDIEKPSDLEGKTIATNCYPTGMTTLLQGLLTERHGVDASKLSWLANGGSDVFPRHDAPQTISIAAERKDPWDRLLGGEVDGIITDISDGDVWVGLESSPAVHRLFDYVTEDRKLYEETGMFTPLHLIVMSATLDRENPDLARSIYDGFEEAKRLAYQDILNDRSGFGVLYLRERFVEQTNTWGDPWKYGVTANRDTVETFARYNVDQGVTKRQLAVEELFAKGTLDT